MADESILECHVGLGFKNPNQAARLLMDIVQQVGAQTGFQEQAVLEKALAAMNEPLVRLLSARAIDRLEIRSEHLTVRLDLQFNDSPEDSDEIDLSMLELVPLETDTLELWVFAHDPQFAKYVGFGEIEKLSTQYMPVFLSGLESEKLEMGNALPALATDSLMGSNGNGNHPTSDDFRDSKKRSS